MAKFIAFHIEVLLHSICLGGLGITGIFYRQSFCYPLHPASLMDKNHQRRKTSGNEKTTDHSNNAFWRIFHLCDLILITPISSQESNNLSA